MTRQQANLFILNKIVKMAEKFPDLNFHRLLTNMNVLVYEAMNTNHIQDDYYTESTDILERMVELDERQKEGY